jgi:hypothetical protein
MGRVSAALLFALPLWCVLVGPAEAQRSRRSVVTHDVWSDPAPGVRYLHRVTSVPTHVHVVVADLSAPGVRAVATPHEGRWATVADFAESSAVEVAVNGGFWSTLQTPRGLAAGGGRVWPTASVDPDFGTLAIGADGRASVHLPDDPPALDALHEAVSGRPVLVLDGAPYEGAAEFPTAADRAPRTAAGVSRDGRTLWLVVVDGRQRDSRGMSLRELSALFVELGADRAINLDGGGSSEMFVRHAGGVVSTPSRGRWEIAVDELLGVGEQTRTSSSGTQVFVRGREREVMNHLGVVAPAPSVAVVAHTSDLGGLVTVEPPPPPPPPLPPRVRLGAWRERLAHAAAVAIPASVGVCVVIALLLRRRRRTAP